MALDPPPAGARAGLLGAPGPKKRTSGRQGAVVRGGPLVAGGPPLGGRWPRRAVPHSCSSLLSYAGG
jgi:hypothetical protein